MPCARSSLQLAVSSAITPNGANGAAGAGSTGILGEQPLAAQRSPTPTPGVQPHDDTDMFEQAQTWFPPAAHLAFYYNL